MATKTIMKELFIGGYDLSAYITEKKRFISLDEFETYELMPLVICENLPYELVLLFRYPLVKMAFWFDGDWGYLHQIQYLGRGLRVWVEIREKYTYEGLAVKRRENIVLLGRGYWDEML